MARVSVNRRHRFWAPTAALVLAFALVLATTQTAAPAKPKPKPKPTYGDPGFKRNKQDEATVNAFLKIYGQRMGMGRALRYKVVAGTSPNATGNADALVVTPAGGTGADANTCRVRVQPSLSGDPVFRKLVLAHESFHCWQSDIQGGTHTTPLWVIEGGADWAALSVDPVSFAVGGGNFKTYFSTPEKALFTRSYDAVGFWAHLEEETGDLFPRMPAILRAALSGDQAAYDATDAEQPQFLDTWGSSALDFPQIGPNWTIRKPLVAAPNLAPRPELLLPTETAVKALPYTVAHYEISNVNYPDTQPLIHIQINGHGRLGNKQLETSSLSDIWFCLQAKCDCPPNTEGNPPPAAPLGGPVSYLAVTGGRQGTEGSVTPSSLDDFCHQKQKKPPMPAKAPPIGGGGGGGGNSPAGAPGCAAGCGGSNGDPHLTTFDGRFYDFMAAGEFTLVASTQDSLEVQVREQAYPGSPNLSINTAVAMRVGANRIEVSRGQPLFVELNGQGVIPTSRPIALPGGGQIATIGGAQLQVSWPDGTLARLWSVGTWGVAVLVKPVAARAGKLIGLLGDFDGTQLDDFKTRDGRALGEVTDNQKQLYGVFGESWRIKQSDSLFDYAPGQSTRTFTNRSIPHAIVTTASLSPSAQSSAEAACKGVGVTDSRILDACVLDVGSTREGGFATAAATLQRAGGSFKPSTGATGGSGSGSVGDDNWTAISTGGSNSIAPSIALDGNTAVVAYASGGEAQAATFTPSLSQDVVGLRLDTITSGWDSVSDPVLLARQGGGLQALFAGVSSAANPASGAYLAARNPSGGFDSATRAFSDPAGPGGAAVLAPDGQPLWASARGGLSLLLGASDAKQTPIDAPGTAYLPTIGEDASGRYWLAWYEIGPPTGIRMVQIDPTGPKPTGDILTVPDSGATENNDVRLALSCAQACRIVYFGSGGRIVSWSPGDATPALVDAGVKGLATAWLAAVYLPNGHLWVVWYDPVKRVYRSVQGDASGSGGTPVALGHPPGVSGYGIAAAVAGNDVAVVTNWNTSGTTFARYVNVVRP